MFTTLFILTAAFLFPSSLFALIGAFAQDEAGVGCAAIFASVAAFVLAVLNVVGAVAINH